MNKRIRELIMESVNFRLDPDSNSYEAQVCPEDLEYLAELIVNDCITTLNKRFMGDLNREDMEVRRCIEDVKKHFGVEV